MTSFPWFDPRSSGQRRAGSARSPATGSAALFAAVLAAGCQTSETGQAQAAATEASTPGADVTDAAAPQTSADSGEAELSCQDYYTVVVLGAFNEAYTTQRGTCSVDEDCVLVPVDTACYDMCPIGVALDQEQTFRAALDALSTNECAGAPMECPPPVQPSVEEPPCVPTKVICSGDSCYQECAQPGWPTGDLPGQYVREDAFCGDVACPSFPDVIDPRFHYATSCCTSDGACGVFVRPLGPDCFVRQPVAPSSEQCPSVSLHVVNDENFGVSDTLRGCCRADATCGVDTSPTWGAGCVARADIARAAAASCEAENLDLAELETIPCDP